MSMTNSESSTSDGVGEEDAVDEVVEDAGEMDGEGHAKEQKLKSIASSWGLLRSKRIEAALMSLMVRIFR